MWKMWQAWVLAAALLALTLGLPACSGQLVTGDDDAADDDGADDDGADDDAADDDTADDDAADDDAADDDAADDDAGDDDTIPPQPGFWWDIPGGPLQGSYHFDQDVFCDYYEGFPGVWAADDWQWNEMIGYTLYAEPGPGAHVTEAYFVLGVGPYWFETQAGPDCWIDTQDGWPSPSGWFECHGVHGWTEQGGEAIVDVVDGVFRCP